MNGPLAVVGALALIAFIPFFALGVCVWETWWLLPLWDWSVVAIGGPSIGFAQLLCLNIFLSAMFSTTLPDVEEKEYAAFKKLGTIIVRPVFAYYTVVFYFWWVA